MAADCINSASFSSDGSNADEDGRLPQEAYRLLRQIAHRLWEEGAGHEDSTGPHPHRHRSSNEDSDDKSSSKTRKARRRRRRGRRGGGRRSHMSIRPLKGAMTNEVFECRWIDAAERNLDDGDVEAAASADANEEEEEEEEEGGGGGGEEEEEEDDDDDAVYDHSPRDSHRVVLVRIYGEGIDLFFDREDEIRTFEAVSKAGRGPRLLGRFPNGRIEEFLHARTLTASDIRDPNISAMIAAKMYDFHRLSMPGPQEARIWHRLRDWLKKALTLCGPEHIEELQLRKLGSEIDKLSLRLSARVEMNGIGFCHNDLQYGNIMLDEEDSSITLIDYEYASFNPIAYDIGNHFCEMAADYHTDTPHLLDYSKYPDLQERLRFVRAYLESSGTTPSSSKVEELVKEIERYTLASHLHWGLWGVISACVSEIAFDYMEYARQRFSWYYEAKSKLLE